MKRRLAMLIVLIMILCAFAVPVAANEIVPGECNAYTQGYWKNHEEAWVEVALPTVGGADTQQGWLDILNTPPKGDPWYILAHQYIAAYLNDLESVSMDYAAGILNDYGPGEIPEGEVEADALYLANLFDAFNNNEL